MKLQYQLPYKPSFVHAILAFLDRVPGPAWFLYLLITAGVGITQHLLAYRMGLLSPGEFDPVVGFPGLFVATTLLTASYIIDGGGRALNDFRSLLALNDHEFELLQYDFTTIPRTGAYIAALIGAVFGAIAGFADMRTAPEVVYVFPALRLGIWVLSPAFALPFIYQALRQLRLMQHIYSLAGNISLFRMEPLYKMSRYSAIAGALIFISWFGIGIIANPAVFETSLFVIQSVFWALLILLMFFYPLFGLNRRLTLEKERLLDAANMRIENMFDLTHHKVDTTDYVDARNMHAMLEMLIAERDILQKARTWPWQPGTLTALVSTLLSPLIVNALREFLSNILGL